MSAAGPELPPHLLAKRKRQIEEDPSNEERQPSGAKRSKSPPEVDKRPRVIGPAPPPAPLSERPSTAANPTPDSDESSSEDDDFGPSLPKSGSENTPPETHNLLTPTAPEPTSTTASKRDGWMLVPPKQDDLAARLDPSKQRARGFNTGKGAKGTTSGEPDNAMWTETPEQKLKRLQDAAMGVNRPSGGEVPKPDAAIARRKRQEAEEAARKIQEHAASTRGGSLMEKHTAATKVVEDDPSKRAFDREKDIGGTQVGKAQRKEMLNKAAGFSSKFAGGSFL